MQKRRTIRIISAVAIATSILLVNAGANVPAWGADGKQTVKQIIGLLSSNQNSRRRSDQLAQLIDYYEIAKLAFTDQQWQSFDADERKQVIAAFRELVEKHYYPRWHKIFSSSQVTVASEATSNGADFVQSYLTHPKEKGQEPVVWKLEDKQGKMMLTDLDVNNSGLEIRLKAHTQPRMEKQGKRKFIAWLTKEAPSTNESL